MGRAMLEAGDWTAHVAPPKAETRPLEITQLRTSCLVALRRDEQARVHERCELRLPSHRLLLMGESERGVLLERCELRLPSHHLLPVGASAACSSSAAGCVFRHVACFP